jgi:26S proteasome regulatory subunit N7
VVDLLQYQPDSLTSPHSELSRLIVTDRLHCSIDKVHGVVETTRPRMKTARYETVVRPGDVVMNAVQRLSKVSY